MISFPRREVSVLNIHYHLSSCFVLHPSPAKRELFSFRLFFSPVIGYANTGRTIDIAKSIIFFLIHIYDSFLLTDLIIEHCYDIFELSLLKFTAAAQSLSKISTLDNHLYLAITGFYNSLDSP